MERSKRKPFNHEAGYVASRRNRTGDFVVLYDARKIPDVWSSEARAALARNAGLQVADVRWILVCGKVVGDHVGTYHARRAFRNRSLAYAAMKDPTTFCSACAEAAARKARQAPDSAGH